MHDETYESLYTKHFKMLCDLIDRCVCFEDIIYVKLSSQNHAHWKSKATTAEKLLCPTEYLFHFLLNRRTPPPPFRMTLRTGGMVHSCMEVMNKLALSCAASKMENWKFQLKMVCFQWTEKLALTKLVRTEWCGCLFRCNVAGYIVNQFHGGRQKLWNCYFYRIFFLELKLFGPCPKHKIFDQCLDYLAEYQLLIEE